MDIFISISYIIRSLLRMQNITMRIYSVNHRIMRIYSVNHRIFFWNRYYIFLQLNTYISVCINLVNRNTLLSFRNTSWVRQYCFLIVCYVSNIILIINLFIQFHKHILWQAFVRNYMYNKQNIYKKHNMSLKYEWLIIILFIHLIQ